MAPSRMGAVALVVLANASAAFTNREEMPIVLRVEPALVVDREGGVGSADSEIGEELEQGCREDTAATLIDHRYCRLRSRRKRCLLRPRRAP